MDIEIIELSEVEKISKETNSNIKIIDVRSYDEYISGHIKNAINIPLDSIEDKDFNISLENEIIVYCKSGVRSYQAALILKNFGYKVFDMEGIDNWNYELEK